MAWIRSGQVRRVRWSTAVVACAFTVGAFAEDASTPASASTQPAAPAPAASTGTTSEGTKANADALFQLGQQLFDQYAPAEVKAEYEFPSKEQWNEFLTKLPTLLQTDSIDELAKYAPQARALLTTLRSAGVEDDLADWLEQKLDELDGAQQARALPKPTVSPSLPTPTPTPTPVPPVRPTPIPAPPKPTQPAPPAMPRVPYYELWVARVKDRPLPARAAELMPLLRSVFVAEGLPPGLAWLAEAESSLNPGARSPAGAKGLFQLMPETAQKLGLDTFLPDERTDPEKSAHAAARYLKELHGKFGEWPLALAAYNAGEGRVSRALAKRNASSYAAIADTLPAETRMYVPKVCALVATRTGTTLASR